MRRAVRIVARRDVEGVGHRHPPAALLRHIYHSIKRDEIMWAVQEKFPVLPQLNNSELGELRTLQQIIDRLATELPGLPTAALAASPATAQKKNL